MGGVVGERRKERTHRERLGLLLAIMLYQLFTLQVTRLDKETGRGRIHTPPSVSDIPLNDPTCLISGSVVYNSATFQSCERSCRAVSFITITSEKGDLQHL